MLHIQTATNSHRWGAIMSALAELEKLELGSPGFSSGAACHFKPTLPY